MSTTSTISRPALSGALQRLARLGRDELDGALARTAAFTAATPRCIREALQKHSKRLRRLT
jgi:hypothetical protein